MKLTRRNFLKTSAAAGAGLSLSGLGFNTPKLHAEAREFKLSNGKEYTSICTFCSCGCGMVCYVKDGKMINLEGDPDHVVNEGSLCSKGAAMSVIPNSEERVKTPLYRAPNTNKWVPISWEEAIDKTAKAIKKTRDQYWIATEKVGDKEWATNRSDAISFVGGSQVNNEECFLMSKMARSFGAVFIENQTRVCHSPTVPALSTCFGRGAMTNSWNDIANAKVILIEGSNAAENHPMSAKFMLRAKEKGAKIIHVDPRFTRTSKLADIHAQIRPGTDIAFIGSIINYIIQTKAYDDFYVNNYTNSKFLVRKDYKFEDGIFSGYDPNNFKYDTTTWNYELDEKGLPKVAASIDEPNTVFSLMKKHFSRYDFKTASDITGIPVEKIKEIADVYIQNSPGTVLYALGLTQHTVGVQNIRSFGVLQLLLGNVGKPGTGINALRGEPNVQGTTDFALLFHYLPGYLSAPNHNQQTIEDWTKSSGTFRSKFLVSLLKSWYGDNATAENDYCFGYIPKKNGTANYTIFRIFETAVEKKMKFMYVMGQNPAVTNPNLNLVYAGLDNLETLVVADPFMTETASFWERPGADPKQIATEVIFLPAASFLEKEGTLINSSRMVQWRYAGLAPVGEAKPDLEIIDLIYNKVRELYKNSNDKKDEVFKKLVWNYPKQNCADFVLREINGYNLATGELLKSIGEIKGDGTCAGGNWLYAGCYANGQNLTQRKDNKTDPSGLGLFPGYSWTWPGNMRILYNRASCDANGKPFDDATKLVWWDAAQNKWAGYDIPDVPKIDAAPNTPAGKRPFRMSAEGVGRFFGAFYKEPDFDKPGLPRDSSTTNLDAPFPEFYEPVESPTKNILHPKVASNPALKYPRLPNFQKIGDKKDYPYVLFTSSVTEHWCCGAYTRNVPWLNELVKETYIEVPTKLADKLGLKGGDMVKVKSARGEVQVKAMVTERIQPMVINGEEVMQVWMPYNWGFKGLSQAASTNLVTIDAGDPNTWIQETKACLINIEKV